MPVITIESGKLSNEQKQRVITEISDKMTEITHIPKNYMTVIIHENEDMNMGVGGESVSEIKARRI